jgi:hypothetical protein
MLMGTTWNRLVMEFGEKVNHSRAISLYIN